jgi:hypothetical protein
MDAPRAVPIVSWLLESAVLSLMLILLVTGLTLMVFFYVGSMFLQGYIYTEPSRQLYWQAPAAGGALMLFLMLWCVLVASAEGASPTNIPYNSLLKFSASVYLLPEPAREIWAVKKNGDKIHFRRKGEVTGVGQTSYRYYDPVSNRPWRNDGVDSVLLVIGGDNYLFKRNKDASGPYGEFVSDDGWVMVEYEDGPTGQPSAFRWGLFLMNMFLNVGHFLLWWLCLWLILRFQWSHALGLGFILWLLFTFTFLPMLLGQAAAVAENRTATTRQVGS